MDPCVLASHLEELAAAIRAGTFRVDSFSEDRDIRLVYVSSNHFVPADMVDMGGRVLTITGAFRFAPASAHAPLLSVLPASPALPTLSGGSDVSTS